MNNFPALRFAVAAGIFLSVHAVIVTAAALAGIPGMRPFAELLTQFYGPYGYSISAIGIVTGAILGFLEGFVHFGIFGLIYRWLPISRLASCHFSRSKTVLRMSALGQRRT